MAAAAEAAQQFLSAARDGNSAEVRRLLAEASPQKRLDLLRAGDEDWFHFTALHYATFQGRERRLAALLDAAGPEGSPANGLREVLLARHMNGGFTALHNAAFFGHVASAAALLSCSGIGKERREVLLAKDENDKTPLELAEDWSQHKVARFLRAAEAVAAAEAAVMAALEGGSISLLHGAIRRVAATEEESIFKVRTFKHVAEAVREVAVKEGSLASLRVGAVHPEAAGVGDSELEMARDCIRLMHEVVEAALQAAVAGESIPSLQVAREQTKAAATQQAAEALQRARQHARL